MEGILSANQYTGNQSQISLTKNVRNKTIQVNHVSPFSPLDRMFCIPLNDIWKTEDLRSKCEWNARRALLKKPSLLKLFQFSLASTIVRICFKAFFEGSTENSLRDMGCASWGTSPCLASSAETFWEMGAASSKLVASEESHSCTHNHV